VSARLVLEIALSGLLFHAEEIPEAPCTFGQRCVTEPAGKKQNLAGHPERSEAKSKDLTASRRGNSPGFLDFARNDVAILPRKISSDDGFPAEDSCARGNSARFAPAVRDEDDPAGAGCELLPAN
jgi:hypothetical protein